ncbi:MAG: outer membrane lipoprotein chaperone LolA [Gammaproteobacteria bacterium]
MALLIRFSLALLLSVAAPAWADQPGDYFDTLRSLQADFTQTVLDETGQTLEQSSGEMYMQRPGRFRWEYRTPYSQLIVADGTRIWLYDLDLEQVTVRKLDDTLSSAPLAMLGNDAPLATAFVITRLGERDGLVWYDLKPKQSNSEVSFVRLGFQGSELRMLEVEDSLRRLTRMALSKVQRNPSLAADLFVFTPPPGVDVIGDS